MKIKLILVMLVVSIIAVSCTVYTEAQSKALSKSVYATKDSLEKARIDLAVEYTDETTRLVKPPKPKDRVKIESVYKDTIPVIASSSKPKNNQSQKPNKQRVIIIPEQYKNDTVVVVNSEEYQQLLKDKQILNQLINDHKLLQETKEEVDDELAKQQAYANKMIIDLNNMQKLLLKKDLAILQRNIAIVLLVGLIGVATYLRIKGIL